MRKNSLITAIFIVMLLVIYFGVNNSKSKKENNRNNDQKINNNEYQPVIIFHELSQFYPEIPQVTQQIVTYTGFDLSYNEVTEQADWVIYLLTKQKLIGNTERSNNFKEDSNILTGSATPGDYKSSGYDRGHLAPAADMKWSELSMKESFLMSNISPQLPGFNRGIWKKLEDKVRLWASENDSLIVVCGPLFNEIKGKIGLNEVIVPGYYFKIVLDVSWPDYKVIAFLFKNESSELPLKNFVISIDSLENFCSCNFFSEFHDNQFEMLENKIDTYQWGL